MSDDVRAPYQHCRECDRLTSGNCGCSSRLFTPGAILKRDVMPTVTINSDVRADGAYLRSADNAHLDSGRPAVTIDADLLDDLIEAYENSLRSLFGGDFTSTASGLLARVKAAREGR